MNVIANNNNYLFQLVGVYILSGSPERVVLGDSVTVTLICIVDDDYTFVSWMEDSTRIANIKNECELTGIPDTTYNYTCDLANNRYYLIIPPDDITDGIQNLDWRCIPAVGQGSNTWSLILSGTYGSNDMMLHFKTR